MHSTFALFFLIIVDAQGVSVLGRQCLKPQHPKCQFLTQYLELWCDGTNLTNIPDPNSPFVEKSFVHPRYAEAIYINQSCLQHINVDMLMMYGSLKEIDFDGNALTRLPPTSFSHCPNLRMLRISHNNLTGVDPKVFKGLEKLEDLRMNHNQIEFLHPNTFQDLTKLRILTLDHNRLTIIKKRLFLNLVNLVKLDLSGNRLKELTLWDLRGLPQLREINLEGNGLLKIETLAFHNSPKLDVVNLNNNNLSCLDRDLFMQTELTQLSFTGNQLQTPKPDWVRNLARRLQSTSNLKTINDRNEWHCDCEIIPYQRFLLEEMKDLEEHVHMFDVICSKPDVFKGRSLSTLTLTDIDEYHNDSCNTLTTKYKPCDAQKATPQIIQKPAPSSTTTKTTTTVQYGVTLLLGSYGVAEKEVQEVASTDNILLWTVVGCIAVLLTMTIILFGVALRYRRKNRKLKANKSAGSPSNRTESVTSTFSMSDSSSQYDQVAGDYNHSIPIVRTYPPSSINIAQTSHVTEFENFPPEAATSPNNLAHIHRSQSENVQHYAQLDHGMYGYNENGYNNTEQTVSSNHHYHTIPAQMHEQYFNLPHYEIPGCTSAPNANNRFHLESSEA